MRARAARSQPLQRVGALRAGRDRALSVVGADDRGAGARSPAWARSSWSRRGRARRRCTRPRSPGVDRVFVIGGAQAVAALAYGTETVPRVDKIVGPGNAWVAEAKRQVFGVVDIDSGGRPVGDSGDRRRDAPTRSWWRPICCRRPSTTSTPTRSWSRRRRRSPRRWPQRSRQQLATLPRRAIAEQSLVRHGVAVVVALARRGDRVRRSLRARAPRAAWSRSASGGGADRGTAGAIFVGASTPEAAGDYLAGPNHVLPTGGAARYALAARRLRLRQAHLAHRVQPRRAAPHTPTDIVRLANVEGLQAHGRAVAIACAPSDGRRV